MDTKICGFCKEELPKTLEFFATKKTKKGMIFQWHCRKCQKEYKKNHYEINKDKYIKKARNYNKKVADWFDDLKKSLKCSNCEENRWWVLDFHHINPEEKETSVAKLKNYGSKPRLLNEISKCTVLCANCHRDFHYKERISNISVTEAHLPSK